MQKQAASAAWTMAATLTLGACANTTTAPTSSPSKSPVTQSTPRPSSKPAPQGPFAVLVTNSRRQGDTYSIEIVDVKGDIVASTTAKLPLVKANQTVMPPLVSASNDLVFYLDGDTQIRSLSPSRATAAVKTVSDGAKDILTFAVSPDNERVAIALMSQASDPRKATGRGYVEGLRDSSGHVDLWNNIGAEAIRWPVGWHATDLVDAIAGCNTYSGYAASPGPTYPCSYHVVDADSGNRVATICETSPTSGPAPADSYTVDGVPTHAGIVCDETEYSSNASCDPATGTFAETAASVDWSGKDHDFLIVHGAYCSPDQPQLPVAVGSCALSTDGSTIACLDANTSAVVLVSSSGSSRSLGRKYGILGWLDDKDLVVDIDASTLGIVDSSTGTLARINAEHADQIEMVTMLPGAL